MGSIPRTINKALQRMWFGVGEWIFQPSLSGVGTSTSRPQLEFRLWPNVGWPKQWLPAEYWTNIRADKGRPEEPIGFHCKSSSASRRRWPRSWKRRRSQSIKCHFSGNNWWRKGINCRIYQFDCLAILGIVHRWQLVKSVGVGGGGGRERKSLLYGPFEGVVKLKQ